MLDAINGMARDAGDAALGSRRPRTRSRRRSGTGATAIIPAVENGYAMGEDLGLLAAFRAKGARYLTLTHNGHNALADSSNPRKDLGDAETLHGGLSELGRAAVRS